MDDPGFAIHENILTAEECDALERVLAGATRRRAGARHLMAAPVVAAMAQDARLVQIAEGILGGNAVPYRATLFAKSGSTNWLVAWHQDTALPLTQCNDDEAWGPWSMKAGLLYAHAPVWALERVVALRVHLDASTPDNGPLRVIPHSHTHGVLSDAEVLQMAHGRDAVTCTVGRGGVIAMRPLLIHASSKVRRDVPRRVLHIEYADALELAPGVRLALA